MGLYLFQIPPIEILLSLQQSYLKRQHSQNNEKYIITDFSNRMEKAYDSNETRSDK